MKNVIQKSQQGWVGKLGALVAGAAFCLSTLNPTTASAGSTVTQLKYLQVISSLTGDGGQFSAASTPADYVQWAKSKGMTLDWKPNSKLSTSVAAESLVKLLGLNPRKYSGDYKKTLARQGIIISDDEYMSSENLGSLADSVAFQGALAQFGGSPSQVKPGNGIGFGIGWYLHNGLTPPAVPPGPPPGAPRSSGNPHVPR